MDANNLDVNSLNNSNSAPANYTADTDASNGGGIGSQPIAPGSVASQPDVNVTPQGSQFNEDYSNAKEPHKVFQSIMSVLAGPQFKYQVNPNTGTMERTPVQRTKTQLANSIVAGALTGLFAGAGAKGPNAFSQGLGRGGAATMAMRQQKDQQAQQMAKDDYARRITIFENNLRMHQQQLAISGMDYDMHKKLSDGDNDLIQWYRDNEPDAIKSGEMTEQDALKLDPTMHNLLRTGVREAGKNPDGSTHYENTYVLIDPNHQGDTPPQLISDAKDAGILPNNFPNDLRTHMVVQSNIRAKTANMDIMSHVLDNFGKGFTTRVGKPLQQTDLGDPRVNDLVDKASLKYNIDPAVLRGLVKIESNGNPNALSPKGAIGLGQVMPATGKLYNVSAEDLKDPGTNIDVAAHYLRDLLDKNGDDPKKALARYHGIGSDGNTTDSQYVNAVYKAMGADKEDEFKTQKFDVGDLKQMIQDNPTFAKDIARYIPYAGLPVHKAMELVGKEEETGRAPAGTTARLYELFGGADNVRQWGETYDEQLKARQKLNEINTENSPEAIAGAVAKETAIQSAKEAEQNKNLEVMHNVLESGGPTFQLDQQIPNAQTMNPMQLKQALQSKNVTIPDNFDALYGTAHYQVSPGTYAPRVWQKGTPHEMDAQTAKSYILKYINPQYNDQEFPARQKFRSELYSGNSQDGKSLRNLGTATLHLQVLQEASDALQRNDIPLLNKLAQSVQTNVGKSGPITFDAIAEKVSQEVEKVAMGGNTPYVGQLESGREKLKANASPEQTKAVVDAYTKLMYGRINTLDETSNSQLQEHLHNITPEATMLFQQHGLQTPWDTTNHVQNQNNVQPDEKPLYQGNTLIGYTRDGKTISRLPNVNTNTNGQQ